MSKEAKKEDKVELVEGGSFMFRGNDGNEYELTAKEKLFSEKYLEYYGNGTSAAYEVYECKDKRVASAVAYENLRKPHIIAYVDSLLEDYGFNDENVKKQHLFTLNQFSDLAAKNKAIDMFYKLKGNYAPEQIKHSYIDDDEIDAELRRIRERRERVRSQREATSGTEAVEPKEQSG